MITRLAWAVFEYSPDIKVWWVGGDDCKFFTNRPVSEEERRGILKWISDESKKQHERLSRAMMDARQEIPE